MSLSYPGNINILFCFSGRHFSKLPINCQINKNKCSHEQTREYRRLNVHSPHPPLPPTPSLCVKPATISYRGLNVNLSSKLLSHCYNSFNAFHELTIGFSLLSSRGLAPILATFGSSRGLRIFYVSSQSHCSFSDSLQIFSTFPAITTFFGRLMRKNTDCFAIWTHVDISGPKTTFFYVQFLSKSGLEVKT